MTYAVADGHDVADGSLNECSPQPASKGIQYTRVTYAADRTPVKEGPYADLVYSSLESVDEYQSILTQFGLLNADKNDVTVRVRDDNWDFVRKNGTALKPIIGESADWQMPFPRNITITITDLEDPS